MTEHKPSEAHQRATAAAEELALAGDPVTNRAVRERAGVSMTVASQVAKEWNARVAEQQSVPEVPEPVRARFEGLWREAFVAARQEFETERAALEQKLQVLQEERDALVEDLVAAEAERDRIAQQANTDAEAAAARLDAMTTKVAEQAKAVTASEKLVARAEGAVEAITAERDRLLQQISPTKSTRRD